MIPRIQQWLTEHHARLGVPTDLQPLVLINVNYKYVESYPVISRVLLWFAKDAERPCLATKIADPGLTREAIDFSIQFQNKINDALGIQTRLPRISRGESYRLHEFIEPIMPRVSSEGYL